MWHNHPFRQINKAAKRVCVCVCVCVYGGGGGGGASYKIGKSGVGNIVCGYV